MKTYKDIVGDGGSDVIGQVTEQRRRLQERLAGVKHVVAVMSGKGGVGKSSVAVNIASALALGGKQVGIMDADINGSSIARMTGVRNSKLVSGNDGVQPAIADAGIKVMSIDLFLPEDDAPVVWDATTQTDAFAWRGMVETHAMREFLADTVWGELDYLLLDLPPGTDKLPNMTDLLPKISGTIIVTIPSGVSQFIVSKSLKMARSYLKTPVLGLVENMSAYICSDCGKKEPLFPSGNVAALARQYKVPFLGSIPFDPRLAFSADEGKLFLRSYSEGPAAEAIQNIADQIEAALSAGK